MRVSEMGLECGGQKLVAVYAMMLSCPCSLPLDHTCFIGISPLKVFAIELSVKCKKKHWGGYHISYECIPICMGCREACRCVAHMWVCFHISQSSIVENVGVQTWTYTTIRKIYSISRQNFASFTRGQIKFRRGCVIVVKQLPWRCALEGMWGEDGLHDVQTYSPSMYTNPWRLDFNL